MSSQVLMPPTPVDPSSNRQPSSSVETNCRCCANISPQSVQRHRETNAAYMTQQQATVSPQPPAKVCTSRAADMRKQRANMSPHLTHPCKRAVVCNHPEMKTQEAFSPVPGKAKRKESSSSDGVKAVDKVKKQVSNAGEDRAMLLGFTMMGLSVLMFFLLGIAILKPFMLSVWKKEANCTVIQTDIMDDWIDCSFTCGVDCHGQSKYPCLQILVNVSGSDYVAALHYNEEALQINPQCFYIPKCQRDKNDLLDGVLDVKQYFERKNDTPFACFHRPDSKPEDVILIKKYDRTVVFHCLFWPTLMLIGGASIVGMVKLTQHLSLMCMLYCDSTREEPGNVTPRADSQQSRTRKDEKTLRWRSNSHTTNSM